MGPIVYAAPIEARMPIDLGDWAMAIVLLAAAVTALVSAPFRAHERHHSPRARLTPMAEPEWSLVAGTVGRAFPIPP